MSQTKNPKRYRGLVVSLLVLVLISLTYLIVLELQSKQDSGSWEEFERKLAEQKDVNEAMKVLIDLDEFALNETDKSKVVEQFKQFKSENKHLPSNWIVKRINYWSNQNLSEGELELKVNQLNERNRFVRQERDDFKNKNEQLSSELNKKIKRVDLLEDSVASVNRRFAEFKARKERVRVISFTTKSGKKIHYIGEVENDMANGNGVGIWSNGNIYRGGWKDNLRHGEGAYEWFEGDRYVGEFKDGEIEGEGTYYWKSGERYEGTFKNNKRNGEGTLYDPDGNIKIKGMWKNDKPL